jgi:hypothetical protein
MEPTVLSEFNIVSGPSLYHRLSSIYNLHDREINKIIGEHNLTMEGAALLLERYKPVYENTLLNNQLPLRRLEPSNDMPDEDVNPFLINRQNGHIISNFYGVPYITEGNKLMFV